MLSLLNFPTFNDITTNSTDYASGMFTELMPMLWVVVGITAAVVIIKLLVDTIQKGINLLRGKTHNDKPEFEAMLYKDITIR